MSEISGKIDEINDRTKRIEFYLNNDPETGRKGLIQTVYEHGREINDMKEQRKVEKARAGFWGGVFGGGLVGVFELVKFLLK